MIKFRLQNYNEKCRLSSSRSLSSVKSQGGHKFPVVLSHGFQDISS